MFVECVEGTLHMVKIKMTSCKKKAVLLANNSISLAGLFCLSYRLNSFKKHGLEDCGAEFHRGGPLLAMDLVAV